MVGQQHAFYVSSTETCASLELLDKVQDMFFIICVLCMQDMLFFTTHACAWVVSSGACPHVTYMFTSNACIYIYIYTHIKIFEFM